jgi:hypothetical protein
MSASRKLSLPLAAPEKKRKEPEKGGRSTTSRASKKQSRDQLNLVAAGLCRWTRLHPTLSRLGSVFAVGGSFDSLSGDSPFLVVRPLDFRVAMEAGAQSESQWTHDQTISGPASSQVSLAA